MNARMPKPQEGDAVIVNLPTAEAVPAAEAPAPSPARPTAPLAPAPVPVKVKRSRRVLLMVSVPVLLLAAGGYFWLNGGRYVDTDNAYVQQSIVSLSPDISGRVVSVSVHENQVVAAGDTLFTIDPQPYQIALDQATAALAAARVNVEQLRVAYGTANAKLKSAKDTLDIRQSEFDRKNSLTTKGLAADATLDDVKIALQAAQSAVALEQQDVANAIAALAGNPDVATDDYPAVRSALAQQQAAQRNLSKTTVVAPASGIVSQVGSLNVGQFIATGVTIASLVETDQTWVQANFKETQLADLKDGQPASVGVDAFGDKLECKVASVGAATGAEFSLIPAQNATGNWVKVVQRLPVRIECPPDKVAMLKTGMSAGVSVDTGRTVLDKMLGK